MEDQQPIITGDDANQASMERKSKLLELDYGVASAICYCPLFGLNVLASIAFLATEPQNKQYLRFHAMQSLMLFFSVVALGMISTFGSFVLGFIPVLGGIIALLSSLFFCLYAFVAFCASVFLMFKSFGNTMTKIPWMGTLALKYSSESTAGEIQ